MIDTNSRGTRSGHLDELETLRAQSSYADRIGVMLCFSEQHDIQLLLMRRIYDVFELVVGRLNIQKTEYQLLRSWGCVATDANLGKASSVCVKFAMNALCCVVQSASLHTRHAAGAINCWYVVSAVSNDCRDFPGEFC